ncbi:MAG: type II toxin-antitoxin system RelE/ParE family toxin [Planctomycetia bacterium]|nr:type II toxin-antitoxin system RelE/ParE family toxin [Planctomycetia bacterium]
MRVRDENENWRIMYRIDDDAIVIVAVFSKKTQQTPKTVIDKCRKRLVEYDCWSGNELWKRSNKRVWKRRVGRSAVLPSFWGSVQKKRL